jgi:Amidase
MSDELWRWDAVELARAIRLRNVSSREAVGSTLDRLAEVNPRLNAVTVVLHDQALTDADRADAAVARGESRSGPLHGVPVTIGENIDQVGCATTNGVVAFKDLVATTDSPPVANWKRAGAVVIGRTNTPAFSRRRYTGTPTTSCAGARSILGRAGAHREARVAAPRRPSPWASPRSPTTMTTAARSVTRLTADLSDGNGGTHHEMHRVRSEVRACSKPWGFRTWARPRQEVIRRLEEYQRDLEQEILDVQARIKELREEKTDSMTA